MIRTVKTNLVLLTLRRTDVLKSIAAQLDFVIFDCGFGYTLEDNKKYDVRQPIAADLLVATFGGVIPRVLKSRGRLIIFNVSSLLGFVLCLFRASFVPIL